MKKALHDFLYKKNRQQQIKGFYYVALNRSISEAARIMNLTQSTVTLQIQSLERDLKFKLLNRDSKPISLTKEGEDFYRLVCPLMHEFESIVGNFLSLKNQKEQRNIDIAVHHVAISYMMPHVIFKFREKNPDAKITIRNIPPAEAAKRLKEGKIDLALYPNFVEEPEFIVADGAAYNSILIIRKKHPLAKKPISSLQDLNKFDLIRIDKNLITLPLFEEAVMAYKIKGSIDFENGNWDMLKSLVKQNDFAAVVSKICIDDKDSDLEIKDLSKFFPKLSYKVAVRNSRNLKPIVQDMFDLIVAEAKIVKNLSGV